MDNQVVTRKCYSFIEAVEVVVGSDGDDTIRGNGAATRWSACAAMTRSRAAAVQTHCGAGRSDNTLQGGPGRNLVA